MAIFGKQRAAENELIESLSAKLYKDPLHLDGDCPSADELHAFVKGKANPERRQYLVAHLASCDRCVDFLRRRRARRSLAQEAALVFAAVIVLALVTWIGLRSSEHVSIETVTVDLRPISPTRGTETATGTREVPMIDAKAKRLHLILPAGSEGPYECAILSAPRPAPFLHILTEASLEDHEVVLNLPLQAAPLPPGQYTLALRKQSSGWAYYPIVFK